MKDTRPEVIKFQLIDRVGNILMHGEIDNSEVSHHDDRNRTTSRTIYRVFSDKFLGGCKEFEDTAEIFAACGGCAIQPEMFQLPADTRQLGLF